MEQERFFLWVARINSILFLLLLILSIGFIIFVFVESNHWSDGNTVEVVDSDNDDTDAEDFHLGDLNRICGQDVQYVELDSSRRSEGFSSGGYDRTTRNAVFFVGKEMKPHWLFDTEKYAIVRMNQLNGDSDDCEDKETAAIYYEIIKNDTNNDGVLDESDGITISLTSAQGTDYQEIEPNVTSVLDYNFDKDESILTMLIQNGQNIVLKKFSLEAKKYISQTVLTRIGKKL